jgi:uncharacterized protein (TIGR00255 family)
MAVYSMTGFASASAGPGGENEVAPGAEGSVQRVTPSALSVELRSVNSRFLDLAFRMPDELRGLEPALRDLLNASFRRGKIELRLSTRGESDGAWPQPQTEQLNRLSRLESTVQGWLPKARPLSVHEVLQWCKAGQTAPKLDDAALDAARRAVAALRESRAREGERLVAVLRERTVHLRALAAQAEPLVPAAVARQQQRFVEKWKEAMELTGAAASIPEEAIRERALNEAAAVAIRIDVAEELARLRSHLDEIERLLKAGGEIGKKLDFLIQELLREANTLGSKAGSIELTGIAVSMKVAIEQLREQVQNVE